MELITRPRFYLDVAEEVEYLARKAGPETAVRWLSAVDRLTVGLMLAFAVLAVTVTVADTPPEPLRLTDA